MQIGFITQKNNDYDTAVASTRIRCLDVINMFKRNYNYNVEFYRKDKHYDVIVFQKLFDWEHIERASLFRAGGTKVVFDINVNYLDNSESEFVNKDQNDRIQKMLSVSDYILTSSSKLSEIYGRYHKSVFMIEENIENRFFKYMKKHKETDKVSLLYCGYAVKANELLGIKDVINELTKNYNIEMLYITDYDPQIDIFPYRHVKYDHNLLPKQLLLGDIKLAPRNLEDSYNLGHSATKIAYPMAVGIPIVASPLQSYINRAQLICNSDEDWYRYLAMLIENYKLREYYGYKGRNICKENFSRKKIKKDYKAFFEYVRSDIK